MSNHSKSVFFTILAYFGLFVVFFGIVLPAFLVMYAPAFFPGLNTSGLSSWLEKMSISVSFISSILGAVSIFQAKVNTKQAEELMHSIQHVEATQSELTAAIHKTQVEIQKAMNGREWNQDPPTE